MSSPEDLAEDRVRARMAEIQSDLKRISVDVEPDEIFQPPQSRNDKVELIPNRESRVRIVVLTGVPGLLNGQIVLDVDESYSYTDLKANPSADLKLLKYSYQFSYMPELMIERKLFRQPAKGYWGDLLLTQCRIHRFDGEDLEEWRKKPLDYRNAHPPHHYHSGPDEYVRWPIQSQPSVLSVACSIIFSFQHEKWRDLTRHDSQLVDLTKLILPHVES
jgi:hypothetical protein